MIPAQSMLRDRRGQAMTELVLVMPVIAVFFAAVFYFGFGMNQKIENKMAVRYAAFVHNVDQGRDPDDRLTVTSGDLQEAFFTRGKSVSLNTEDWNDMALLSSLWAGGSFAMPAIGRIFDSIDNIDDIWDWLDIIDAIDTVTENAPHLFVAGYLGFTRRAPGTHAVTRTTISPNDTGFPFLTGLGNKTVEASLYVDLQPMKLEAFSFNLGDDPLDPGSWDFGYLPIMLAYMVGWDWDFAQNSFSMFSDDDTDWLF